MKTKDTDDLQAELTDSATLTDFLRENQEMFIDDTFSDMLRELFRKSGLSKAALAKRAGTSEVYLYQLFSGERTPSRDRAICLCYGLGATLEETQELLRRSRLAQLYVKDRRDAIIIYGLLHQTGLDEINDRLFEEHEVTLC